MENEFSKRLRRIRKRNRQSAETLSELCNLSKDMIRQYELGSTEPSAKSLCSIADYFNVSMDYLYGRSNDPRILNPTFRNENPDTLGKRTK